MRMNGHARMMAHRVCTMDLWISIACRSGGPAHTPGRQPGALSPGDKKVMAPLCPAQHKPLLLRMLMTFWGVSAGSLGLGFDGEVYSEVLPRWESPRPSPGGSSM